MAHKMSPEEYQELGRRYYKLRQYKEAVEAFTKGIDTAPTLNLFDHRAAAYDRLEDYNAAVKDGREMIKTNKQDVKGYLRTASILEKMEKPETALSIYKYGMKNVPSNDKNFKVYMVTLHAETMPDQFTAAPATPRQNHTQTIARKVRRPTRRPPHRTRRDDTRVLSLSPLGQLHARQQRLARLYWEAPATMDASRSLRCTPQRASQIHR
jgi:tetratricopeptide (TPR) repeat protein